MESYQVQRAVAAARLMASELGYQVNDATVIHNSDRIAVRLVPCDLLVRVAPQAGKDDLQFEAEVAHQLAEANCPVGLLAPRAEPRVYIRDIFALTFWIYYKPVGEIAPPDYANALFRLHAGLRQIDLAAPHISLRFAGWKAEVEDREQTPDLPDADRELLRDTFQRAQEAMNQWEPDEQLLHGEPHPGNVLNTSEGPLFIDLQTCQRGPIEYDVAFLPDDVAACYPSVNQEMLRQYRILNWAGFTTMRWRATDQFPDQAYWRAEGFARLRAALNRE